MMSCGAGVNVSDHPNPIWADRKYSLVRMVAMNMSDGPDDPDGVDCENLSPTDGEKCRAWQRREMTPTRIQGDAARLPAAITRVAQVWMSDTGKMPKGIQISIQLSGGLTGDPSHGATYPFCRLEAFLQAAGAYLAPDWDIDMARYIYEPPKVMMGRYQGEVHNG